MVLDPRCERLTAKSTLYYTLVGRVGEQTIARIIEEDHCPFSLCLTDYKFLSSVASSESGMASMTELARLLHLHPSSATRRVRHLLECGLITKTQDSTDDRRYFVALTPAGESLTHRIDEEMLALTRRMYASISDEEMQTVYDFMDKCASSLASMLGETIG